MYRTRANAGDGLKNLASLDIPTSVRRRRKNIDSSSKSNPLRRRRKKYRKSTNCQQKFLWFTYSNNAYRNSGCNLTRKQNYESKTVDVSMI